MIGFVTVGTHDLPRAVTFYDHLCEQALKFDQDLGRTGVEH
jgi:hypothetical protein